MVVAGRMSLKNSPCARPILSHSAMFVTKMRVRTTSFKPAPAFFSADFDVLNRLHGLCVGIADADDFAVRSGGGGSGYLMSVADAHRARIPDDRFPGYLVEIFWRDILSPLYCRVLLRFTGCMLNWKELCHSACEKCPASSQEKQMRCNNILEAVGHTPLVRLNRMNKDLKPQIYVKADYPQSRRLGERPHRHLHDRRSREEGPAKARRHNHRRHFGKYRHGVGAGRGGARLQMVFTITDKQSKEKVDLLKALGAEVIVCPTAVEPDDPRSYYSVAKKLAREIPNSYYPNQYDNPMNPEAHYRTTGPEIWEDTEGKITHFVCGDGHRRNDQRRRKISERKKSQAYKIIGVDPIRLALLRFRQDRENRQSARPTWSKASARIFFRRRWI